jgi:hypothetical protein
MRKASRDNGHGLDHSNSNSNLGLLGLGQKSSWG